MISLNYNDIININSRILDIILCNTAINIIHCDSPLVTEDKHHPALEFIFTKATLKQKKIPKIIKHALRGWNFGQGDVYKLYPLRSILRN